MGNKIFKFSILYFSLVILTYGIWVYFSYLIIPFAVPPYNIEQKEWPMRGYYKIRSGRYENIRYGTKYTVNSKGFRGPEFEDTKTTPSFRIIALGESSTLGMESNDNETWPSRLEQHLLAGGFDVEVINCGIGGTTISHHLAMLKNELFGYKPDLILYYAGRNDHATFDLERYPGPNLYPQGRWHFFKSWAIYKKIQLRFILLKWFNFDIERIIPWPNNWITAYKENLAAILRETQRAGIPFFMVTQIMDYSQDILAALAENPEPTRAIIKRISLRNHNWHLFLRQFDVFGVQREISAEYGNVRILNLYKEFYTAEKSEKRLFYDCVHLTPDGNDLIGISLARQLEAYLSLPRKAVKR